MQRVFRWAAVAAFFVAALGAGEARAQPEAELYRGKVLTIVLGAPTGGSFAVEAMLYQRHMVRHIPGQPRIQLEYMPGAGGARAANYLYVQAPRDGSVIAMLTPILAFAQRTDPQIRYDAKSFAAIGRTAPKPDALVVMTRTGVKTLEQARTAHLVMAGNTKNTSPTMNAVLLNKLLGFNFKIVLGYDGTQPAILAMENGEVDGYVWGWEAVRQTRPQWLRDGTMTALAQIGLTRSPDLPNVPLVQDLAATPEDKALLEFMASANSISRPYAAPPNFPKPQLDILRRAFLDTTRDPDFLAAAQEIGVDVDPLGGAALQKIIDDSIDAPAAMIARLKQLTDLE